MYYKPSCCHHQRREIHDQQNCAPDRGMFLTRSPPCQTEGAGDASMMPQICSSLRLGFESGVLVEGMNEAGLCRPSTYHNLCRQSYVGAAEAKQPFSYIHTDVDTGICPQQPTAEDRLQQQTGWGEKFAACFVRLVLATWNAVG